MEPSFVSWENNMKIHPFARIAALGLILLALGTATAFARPEKSQSGLPPPNLAIGVDAPGAVRAEVRVVDLGPDHACAVNTQQDVWCWGLNTKGQFGTGVATSTRIEEPVTAAQRVF